jgi:two-component system sensor histidine kinase CpxA
MKSLYVRIFVIFSVAFCFTSLVLGWTWMTMDQDGMRKINEITARIILQHAQDAYTTGGAPALARFMAKTGQFSRGEHYVTDTNGRDLLSGADLSALKPTDYSPFRNALTGTSHKNVSIISSSDSPYRLITVSPAPPRFDRLHFFIILIPFGIVLLGWYFSVGFVSPLVRLTQTVDRFGRGDLSARAESKREDEIGILARSFDNMADRIETLLNSERRLLQDVSHELRSPLMRLGFAAELMKNPADPEAAAKRMQREIARLSSLVESLLEVKSSENDSALRVSEGVSVVPLIEEIVDDGRFEADARNVKITTQINSHAIVHGNPELLRRAIENVLRNAIRYAGPSSEIQMQVNDSNVNTIISVRDFGPGVPEELLKRIFDPFFRVDKSRDRAAGGIGLGLSIARRAVLLHHGEIAAENAHPGLRVKIALPTVSA